MSTIQIRRKLTGAIAAPPVAAAGEPMFSVPGFTGGGPNSLYIGDGTTAIALVDRTRQVEIAGTQTITGAKTFAAGATLSITDAPTTALHAANKAYVDAAMSVVPLTFGDGLTLTGIDVDLDQATQAAIGGGMIATTALIAAGASDTTLVSPLGLRSQLGADVTTLVTTAKNVVGGMNEIYNTIAQLEGVVIYAGTYDATTSTGTYNGQGGIATGTGPLPAAAAANHGAYVIATVAGAGGGAGEPAGPIDVGDWLMSDGTAWTLLAFAQPMGAYLPLSGGTLTGALTIEGDTRIEGFFSVLPPDAIAGTLVSINAGNGATLGGELRLNAGQGGSAAGGPVSIVAGDSATGAGGYANLKGGRVTDAASTSIGGPVAISGGAATAGRGGEITLRAGSSVAGNGGDIILTPGSGASGGLLRLENLPAVTQTAVDAIWNNAGVLNIGAGGLTAGGATFFDPASFTGDGLSAATQIVLAAVDGGIF